MLKKKMSLNVVVGGEGLNTIKLPGLIQKQKIIVLIDSGSTHSFVDPMLVHQLKLPTEAAPNLTVTVANGEKLSCDQVCKGLQWEIHGEIFEKDCRMLKLGGCDIVLGMDWIDIHAPIQLHTRPLSASFHKEGKRVILKGLTAKQKLKAASKKEVNQWKAKGVKGFLVVCEGREAVTTDLQGEFCGITESQTENAELKEILQEFLVLFQEPKTQPPTRPFDHEIPLLPNAKPINIGPYRYSHEQKNVIEQMVEEMLSTGIITPSTSPFASPVLLVPKKDSTWRFCVDYRALNAITIKKQVSNPSVGGPIF